MGSFFSSLLNLVATKWILPATSYLLMYMLGAGVSLIAIIILLTMKEELDIEHLNKKGALISLSHEGANKE